MVFHGIAPGERPLIVPVFVTHRGCPHRCAFCDQEVVAGKGDAPDEMPAIVTRYREWSAGDRPVALSFYGGSFTALPEAEMKVYLAAGKKLLAQGLVGALRCSTRPDAIDAAKARFLKESGFSTVEIGAQTMSDALLGAMERGHTAADTRRAVEILKAAGLSVVLQFMSGYPEETPEDIAVTCRALAELHPDAIRIYPFTPLDDTKIAERLQRGETRFDPETAIDRAADLFLAAQEAGIPTIRIGLPKENLAGSPYPDNLAQVVMAEALVKVAARGEREFHIPVSWRTSLAIARRSGHFPADATVVFVS